MKLCDPHSAHSSVARGDHRADSPRKTDQPLSGEVTIEPGLSIGPLKLGDTRDRALELFPKKGEDQEWENSCGTTLDWVDATNRTGRGDLFIRLNKKGKSFPDRIRHHALSHRRRHHHLRSRRKSRKRLQRPARLHSADPARPGSRRPPAGLLGRQEERHRLRLRLLSAGAQTLSLQDHRVRAQQNFLSRGRNHQLSEVAIHSEHALEPPAELAPNRY